MTMSREESARERAEDRYRRQRAACQCQPNDLPDDMPIEHICLLTDLLDHATAQVAAWRDKLNNGDV
jgi:hypothetical protein